LAGLPQVRFAPKLVEFGSALLSQQHNRETVGFGRSELPEANEQEGREKWDR
jgi:hypothetical protein